MIRTYAEYAAKKSILPLLPALTAEFNGLITFTDACKIIAQDVERFEQEMGKQYSSMTNKDQFAAYFREQTKA